MKPKNSMNELELRATEALRAVLGQVSVIKLKEIRRGSKGSVLADVDVLGHRHTLACEVKANAQPENLRTTLRSLSQTHRQDAIPVVIAPYMSPEAQTLCKESHAGFIDLEGNARLAVGEIFIGKRALTPHSLSAAARPVRSVAPRAQIHPAA